MGAEAGFTLLGWLALAFGIIRGIAVIAGIWFQVIVTWQRYQERQRVCSDPDALPVECAIQQWHLERGYLLMAVHILLLGLSIIALVVRLSTPPLALSFFDLATRMTADLLFTLIVVTLALVSIRARHHHRRVMALINVHLESPGPSAVARADHLAVSTARVAAKAQHVAEELHKDEAP
jgi:hypothetical protein